MIKAKVPVSMLESNVKRGRYAETNVSVMLTAGFEERNLAFISAVAKFKIEVDKTIILDYPNKEQNEPVRSRLISIAKQMFASVEIVEIGNMPDLSELIDVPKTKLLLDITGLTRFHLFHVLYALDSLTVNYDIVYTEAETYFPLVSFLEELTANQASDEVAFSRYLDKEQSEFVYTYDCETILPNTFAGRPEPGKPAMLISFLTFKRSRLQLIIEQLQFEKRLLILSIPVRNDLAWRKRFMEIANWDLIQNNRNNIVEMDTLDSLAIKTLLNERTYVNKDYSRYNLFLAPLGSKMQTIGSYLYWKEHPDVSVVFSQPNSYFKDAYSKSYRDTFVLPYEEFRQEI